MSPLALREAIRRAACGLGFARVGFAAAAPLPTAAALAAWCAAGYAGPAGYLTVAPAARADPRSLLPTARTVVAVLLPYAPRVAAPVPGSGRIARYARGADYHQVLNHRLRHLAAILADLAGRPVAWRLAVDTAPLLERAVAHAAGLGFIGKNTQLITPGVGSYTLLGELLVDLELPPDDGATPGYAAATRARCGRCRACLDACPTAAFAAPYVLDARRCLSALTIEERAAIPRALRPALGDRLFGCDACLEACPFNRAAGAAAAAAAAAATAAAAAAAAAPAAGAAATAAAAAAAAGPSLPAATAAWLAQPALADLLALGAKEHRRRTRGTALWRHPRALLQRNAAIALGNGGDPAAVKPLAAALAGSPWPLVRGHAAWALGRLGGPAAVAALVAARRGEPDAAVGAAIDAAVAEAGGAAAES